MVVALYRPVPSVAVSSCPVPSMSIGLELSVMITLANSVDIGVPPDEYHKLLLMYPVLE
jgi:hypothetical protein